MHLGNFPEQVGQVLQRVCHDMIQLEQYMDFLRNRTFRQTLLCHARCTPNYRLEPATLASFFVGSPLQSVSPRPDLHSSAREDFRRPSGSFAFSTFPIVKAALVVLGEAWPRYVPFDDLCSQARAKLDGQVIRNEAIRAEDKQQVGQALLKFYTIAGDLVEFRLHPSRVTTQPGTKPLTRALARWQARSGRSATNLRHESVTLDEFGRQVLQRLDGQRTRTEMVRELVGLVLAGQLNVHQDGKRITEPERIEQAVVQFLDGQIDAFAQRALLMA
jgi:methyltransferase-like protein